MTAMQDSPTATSTAQDTHPLPYLSARRPATARSRPSRGLAASYFCAGKHRVVTMIPAFMVEADMPTLRR